MLRLTPHLRLKIFSLLDTLNLFKLRELNHATYEGAYGICNSGFVQEGRDIAIKIHIKHGKCLVEKGSIYARYLSYCFSMVQSIHLKLEVEENVACHSSEHHLAEILHLVPVRIDERKVSIEVTSRAYNFEFSAGLFLSLLDKDQGKLMEFDQVALVGKFKRGLNDLAQLLPRCSSVSLPRLYGLRKFEGLPEPPAQGYLRLQKLRLNADILYAIPTQYLQKLVGLVQLDFEVLNTAKWKDILLFTKSLPDAVNLKLVNLIDQRSMPRQLSEVLGNFLKWHRLTSKSDTVTYTCENLIIQEQIQ